MWIENIKNLSLLIYQWFSRYQISNAAYITVSLSFDKYLDYDDLALCNFMFAYLSVCMSVCLSVCLFAVCLAKTN